MQDKEKLPMARRKHSPLPLRDYTEDLIQLEKQNKEKLLRARQEDWEKQQAS
jgi:hypothetical protein